MQGLDASLPNNDIATWPEPDGRLGRGGLPNPIANTYWHASTFGAGYMAVRSRYRTGSVQPIGQEGTMTVKSTLARKGTHVPVIGPDALVEDALRHLENDDVSALVVTSDGSTIEGILSASDIVRGLKYHGPRLGHRHVREIMTRQVVTCDISERMLRIYELMTRHHIRHVPITRGGKLCGIVSILDVVRHRLGEIEAEAKSLRDYVAGAA